LKAEIEQAKAIVHAIGCSESTPLVPSVQWLADYAKQCDRQASDLFAVAIPSPLAQTSAQGWREIRDTEPQAAMPSVPAWLYSPKFGVQFGSVGRFGDGVFFGFVSGLNGCAVRDWEATHYQLQPLPSPPPQEPS
jgi:hypothetical protein